MPYLPARVTSERCENGCLGRGFVDKFSAPDSYGVSKEILDTRPEGYSAYHCPRCGFVWFKKPRSLKGMIPVGYWNSKTKTFTPYSPV
jgi:DNA-directed RNA polymerase subunit RPC12/RpoP